MESNIKASFIPDKMPSAHSGGSAPKAPSGSAVDILMLVAVVILAVSLALSAAVFLYDSFLNANVQRKGEQLQRAQQAFEPALVEELVRLDLRLQAANDVLSRHLAPSEMFNLLEELTLQSVSYSSLDYSINEDETIAIRMKGKADSVNAVALQASVFGQNNAIVSPIFSDIDLVSDGVAFSVSATVNPAALRYTTVFSQYSTGVESEPAFEGENSAGVQEADSFGDFGSLPDEQEATQ
tara:strand:- start:261 stop:977 length:717 start_codon:yes stop_codon:yes gene_type:complete